MLLKSVSLSGIVAILYILLQQAVVIMLARENSMHLAMFGILDATVALVPAFLMFGGDPCFQVRSNAVGNCRNYPLEYLGGVFGVYALLTPLFILALVFLFDDWLMIWIAGLSSLLAYATASVARFNRNFVLATLLERSPMLAVFGAAMLWLNLNLFHSYTSLSQVILFFLLGAVILIVISTRGQLSGLKFGFREIRGLLYSGNRIDGMVVYFWATAVLVYVYERADQFLAYYVFGPDVMAAYYAVLKLSFLGRLLSSFSLPFTIAQFSRLASRDLRASLHSWLSVGGGLTLLSLVLLLPLIAFPREVLQYVYGNEYSEYGDILCLVAISMVFSCWNQVAVAYLGALGASKFVFFNSLAVILLQMSVFLFLSGSIGAEALAVSRLTASIFGFAALLLAVRSAYMNSRIN
jgi:O-antigen/teichoic acid export membrane protein